MKKKLLSFVVWFNLLIVGSVFLYIAFLVLVPRAWWGEYEYIRFVNKETGGLVFVSKNVIHHSGDFDYQDILKCDNRYYSEYQSGTVHIQPREWTETEWLYQAPYPESGLCYLDSTTCIKLPFGIERCQQNRSDEFRL
jgi:hypothetical protein